MNAIGLLNYPKFMHLTIGYCIAHVVMMVNIFVNMIVLEQYKEMSFTSLTLLFGLICTIIGSGAYSFVILSTHWYQFSMNITSVEFMKLSHLY